MFNRGSTGLEVQSLMNNLGGLLYLTLHAEIKGMCRGLHSALGGKMQERMRKVLPCVLTVLVDISPSLTRPLSTSKPYAEERRILTITIINFLYNPI